MKIALFVPCYVKAVAPGVIDASVRLLESLGCSVEIPAKQTCCGQPQGNGGYEKEASALSDHFVDLFGRYDVVVSPSSSCVTYVREHYADRLQGRLFEICEFIHDVLKPTSLPSSFPHKVSLHNSCHGARLAGLSAPSEMNVPYFNKLKDLLSMVQGLELLEPERPDECCGFGGLFSVEESPISIAMGRDKVERHLATGAEYITAADSSCLMHQGGIIAAQKLPLKTIHIIEILASGL